MHFLFGLADTTSIIIATVLGLLVLVVAVLVVSAVIQLASILSQAVREAPDSVPTGDVTPGNLPSAPVASDIAGVQPDESAKAPEVWE